MFGRVFADRIAFTTQPGLHQLPLDEGFGVRIDRDVVSSILQSRNLLHRFGSISNRLLTCGTNNLLNRRVSLGGQVE